MFPILEFMDSIASLLAESGDAGRASLLALESRGFHNVVEHALAVARTACSIAEQNGLDSAKAETAALLHDVSVIIPNEHRVAACERLGIGILDEEAMFPMLLHQKLSREIAARCLGVDDAGILSAIGCHTTLKAGASMLDMAVFISDKISWDQVGAPPYLARIEAGMEISLVRACLEFIAYQMEHKENLKIIHPWFQDAYDDLIKSAIVATGRLN